MAYQYEIEAFEPEVGEPTDDIEIEPCFVCGVLADTDETECLGRCRTEEASILFEDALTEDEAEEQAREEFLARTEAEAMLRWKWTY